ncbi:MAG: hypothetical protein K2N23_05405 [Clostridia bacterium]|nr:hypothetical protein [Clostridia bacterium]
MNYDIEKQLEELQKKYYLAIDEAFKAKTVLGETIFEEMRQDLFDRYRIERDQLKEKAKIPDKNINFETKLKIYELTPHRRGFLWLLKNEARKLKEREVNADDRMELDARTDDVEQLEEKIYGSPEPPEEQPKKLSFLKRLFKRCNVLEQIKNTIQAADETAPADVIEQPEPPAAVEPAPGTAAQVNGSTREPATVSQHSEPSTAAHGASDATHQSDKNSVKNTVDVAKPPAAAPSSEEPKPKAKPKKVTKPAAEPPAPTAPAPQLSGQIAIDELNNK